MASYTLAPVVFSAAQEAGFDMVVFKTNAARAAQSPSLPALTKQQYLDALVGALPADFLMQGRNDLRDRAGVAMQTASPATLVSVASTLGIDANPYD